VLAAVIWLAALGLLALAGWFVAIAIEPSQTAWRPIYVAATVAAGLVLATGVRWLWLRLRRPVEGRLTSTWVPVTGIVLALTVLGVGLADATSIPPPVDPQTWMRAGAGYTIEAAEPEVEEEFRTSFAEDGAMGRSMVIKKIVGDDGSAGYLIVVDMGVPAMLEEVMLELVMFGAEAESTTDVDAVRETLAGRQVFTADVEDSMLIGWIDTPLLAFILAADDPSGRAMAESVIRAHD
jgi:hypothetical protein